jgi:hypothetical protein
MLNIKEVLIRFLINVNKRLDEKSSSIQDLQMKLFPLGVPYDVVPAGFQSLALEEGPERHMIYPHKKRHNNLLYKTRTYWVCTLGVHLYQLYI